MTLLEALAARPTTLPRVPTTLAAADALVEAGEASWDAQLDQWLGSNQSVLLGAQATGSLVAAAWADLPTSQPANLPVRDAGMAAMAFTDHVVAYLNRILDLGLLFDDRLRCSRRPGVEPRTTTQHVAGVLFAFSLFRFFALVFFFAPDFFLAG